MNNYRTIVICFIVAVICQFSCAPISTAGGSSSTDNGKILGMIQLENGIPASKIQVTLHPADSDPFRDSAAPPMDTTDITGGYAFDNLAPGHYTMEAVSLDQRTRALVYNIAVDSVDAYAPTVAVLRPGALRIKVPDDSTASIRYVYLPGTSLYGIVQNGLGFIDSVPAGTIPIIYYVNTASPTRDRIMGTNVTIASGATREVADSSSWNYSKRLFLNTTAAGADVSASVFNFPVLVRFSGANFDFGRMRPDGSDLRFRKSDDTPLPYEIERWDPVAKLAEVWVKVDTVYGNDSAHFFTMYWGAATMDSTGSPQGGSATSLSNGAAVFDTASGFQGVWHLGDAPRDSIHDATANRYSGISPDSALPAVTEGVIGNCRQFNGSSDFITMPNTAGGKLNFPQDGFYTVSAWVFIGTFSAIPQLIVSKGYEQYFLWATNYPTESPFWEFYEFSESANWEWTTSSATGGQWELLTGVRQGKNQFLYCNGVFVDSIKDVSTWGISRDTSNDLSIGGFLQEIYDPSYEGYCFLRGSIDEVRIISAAQSPDWVRLCYMNQRSDDRLVVFK